MKENHRHDLDAIALGMVLGLLLALSGWLVLQGCGYLPPTTIGP
jgi:hypothetical protein